MCWRSINWTILALAFMTAMSSTAATSTQRLACFYFNKEDPHDGVGAFNPTFPSAWAKGMGGEDIYVTGTHRDGFFQIVSLKGKTKSLFGMRVVARYDNNDELAHEFCRRGLKAMFPDSYESVETLNLGVKLSFLSTKYTPVVFKKHQNPYVKDIDRLVVFGDSLSDQGNLKRFLKLFPSSPYFAGRFSNSWIWVDYFKKMTGLSVQNWAIGGSVSDEYRDLEANNETFSERLRLRARTIASGSVRSEINQYKKSSLSGGKIVDGQKTFFALWAGGNDYIHFLEKEGDADTFLDEPHAEGIGSDRVIKRVINNVITHAKNLYSLGARNFLIANMPDLGKMPMILENTVYHKQSSEPHQQRIYFLSTKMTEISNLHNILLKKAVEELKALYPDINVSYVDVAQAVEQTKNSINFEDGMTYFNYDLSPDFKENISYAGKTIVLNRSCYLGRSFITDETKVCEEPNRTLFWDGVHPSSYGHCLIAAYFHRSAATDNAMAYSGVNEYLKLCRPELIEPA